MGFLGTLLAAAARDGANYTRDADGPGSGSHCQTPPVLGNGGQVAAPAPSARPPSLPKGPGSPGSAARPPDSAAGYAPIFEPNVQKLRLGHRVPATAPDSDPWALGGPLGPGSRPGAPAGRGACKPQTPACARACRPGSALIGARPGGSPFRGPPTPLTSRVLQTPVTPNSLKLKIPLVCQEPT